MSNMEINGLQAIVSDAVKRGTLHAIAPRPRREDFMFESAYLLALRRWQRNGMWTVTNIGQ